MSPSVSPQALTLALVAEAAKKSRVCWLTWSGSPGGPPAPRLVWHAWYDGALLVLSGAEQLLPGIDRATTAQVVMRSKDTGGRLVTWTGAVSTVDPASDQWDAHAAALLGVRLNLADPSATAAQWRTTAAVVRVVPVVASESSESSEEAAARPLP